MRAPAASTLRGLAAPETAWRALAAARSTATWLEERRRLVLGALVVLQWGGLAAIALLAPHAGWVYYNGGDGSYYWTGAWALGHLELPRAYVGYGNSVLWAPAGAALGPSMAQGLPFVVCLNALVFAPLALLALYGVAERIAGRLFGLFAAFAWLVTPLVAYRLTRPDIRPRIVDVFLPGASGLNALADFPSLVLVLGAAYFALRAIDLPGDGGVRRWPDALAAGTLAGFALGTKPANTLFVPAVVVLFALARRWRQLGVAALGFALPLLALAVWKQRGLGTLPLFSAAGEVRLAAGPSPLAAIPNPITHYGGVDWDTIRANLAAIREIFWSKTLLEWFALAGAFALLRRSFVRGAFVVCWFGAYFLVKSGSEFANVFSMSYFRLLEPAYPAFLLLAAGSMALLWPRAGRAPRPAAPIRPLRPRLALALVVVLGLLPLALVSLASPAGAGRYASIASAGVQVSIRDLGLFAAVDGGAVHLSWERRAGNGYRVFRTPGAADADCSGPGAGAGECSFPGDTAANVEETSFVDRPGTGTWTYRIAPVGAWNGDLANGDPLLLSRPVTVRVP